MRFKRFTLRFKKKKGIKFKLNIKKIKYKKIKGLLSPLLFHTTWES